MRLRSAGARRGRLVCAAFAMTASCGPVEEPSGSGAPVNACPDHPCAAYSHGPAATCGADGACTAGPPPTPGIELVIAVPQDSFFAPSMQYLVPLEHIGDCASPQVCTCAGLPADAGPDAGPEVPCGHLPWFGTVSGAYVMSACAQSSPDRPDKCPGAGFFLGNEDGFGHVVDAWLPVRTTYRLLEDPWHTDVAALGLSPQPVLASQSTNPFSSQGPYGGPSYTFQAALPPGTYERTITPAPTYDSFFGPDVRDVTVPAGKTPFESVVVASFDVTKLISEFAPQATLPTFDISRADGLDGWTAFLRDATTRRVLSNVQQLSGKVTNGVRLLTHHLPSDPRAGALTNAVLVIVPPSGAPLPTGVFTPNGQQISRSLTYPPLPQGATLTGSVTGPGGRPIAADLVFEALAFTDASGKPNYLGFEFVGRASARPGQGPGGSSSYQVDLPLGPYRVDVRPLDGSARSTVTVLNVDGLHPQQPFALAAPVTVQGRARVADGRPLAAALVEALPQGCPTPPALDDGGSAASLAPVDSPWCLPRPQQTLTDSHGSFTLPLDAGRYRVRVKPADGTRLPWASTVVQVGDVLPTVDLVVPAPFRSTFKLLGADGSPISRAVVRAFSGPVEVAQTLTDVDGTCDLLVALPP